jgi:hypothetical protein
VTFFPASSCVIGGAQRVVASILCSFPHGHKLISILTGISPTPESQKKPTAFDRNHGSMEPTCPPHLRVEQLDGTAPTHCTSSTCSLGYHYTIARFYLATVFPIHSKTTYQHLDAQSGMSCNIVDSKITVISEISYI